ncbi:MAG: hypothetical protein AB1847_15945 [bacterium]
MRKAGNVLVITTLLALSLSLGPISWRGSAARAESWVKVVDKGFGEPSNDYAWGMATFRGMLYVGTLNTLKGAEIWRSGSGEKGTWQRVYNSPSGVFGNGGIRCLYADGDDALYACASNLRGAQILRTTNGRTWIPVARAGTGEWRNYSIRCMVRFKDYLYAGAGPKSASLCRSKTGFFWRPVRTNPSFESTKVLDPNTNTLITNNVLIGELAVFHDQLYVFTWVKDYTPDVMIGQMEAGFDQPVVFPEPPGAFEIFRSSDGVQWEKVVGLDDEYGNGMGFCLRDPVYGLENDVVTSTTVFNDRLYLGTQNSTGKTTIWRTANGTDWEKILDFPDDYEENCNYYIWRMIPFHGKLYIGTMNVGVVGTPGVTGAQIWRTDSGDQYSFYNLVHNGFKEESFVVYENIVLPKNYGIRNFGILNDTLFAGTATTISAPLPKYGPEDKLLDIVGKDIGCEIWKMVE